MATIALIQVDNPSDVGIVALDQDGRVAAFVEKPKAGTEPGNWANAAIYILEIEVLQRISPGLQCDFGYDIIPVLIREKGAVYGYCIENTAYTIDIGTIGKYRIADEDMKAGKVKIRTLSRAASTDKNYKLKHFII